MTASPHSLITSGWTPKHLINSCSSFRPQLRLTWSGVPLTSGSSEFLSSRIFLRLFLFSDFSIGSLFLWTEVPVSLFFSLRIAFRSLLGTFSSKLCCCTYPSVLYFLQGVLSLRWGLEFSLAVFLESRLF